MSTRSVSKQWVAKAATAYLENREERIQRERALLIEYERGPFRRWFKWRHRVRSVAIERARTNDEWDLIEITGGYWANRAESLRSLARAPGEDMISLDREDALFLEPWIDLVVNQ